jgi:hypothetical protein
MSFRYRQQSRFRYQRQQSRRHQRLHQRLPIHHCRQSRQI